MIVFTAASIGVYLALRKMKKVRNPATWRWLILSVWLGGAGLVFSSLFLSIGDDGTGLAVVLRRTSWITEEFNIASSWLGPGIEWLQVVHGLFGYVVYLLPLAATLAMAVWLSFFFVSFRRQRSSRLLVCFAAFFNFFVFWVYCHALGACELGNCRPRPVYRRALRCHRVLVEDAKCPAVPMLIPPSVSGWTERLEKAEYRAGLR